MTIYAVFDKEAIEVPAVVADRFSWFAALLPPIFALAHGLWLELVAYVILVMLLGAASGSIGGAAAVWIYLILAVWIGFEGPAFRRGALKRQGWRYTRDVIAAGEDLATVEALKGAAQ